MLNPNKSPSDRSFQELRQDPTLLQQSTSELALSTHVSIGKITERKHVSSPNSSWPSKKAFSGFTKWSTISINPGLPNEGFSQTCLDMLFLDSQQELSQGGIRQLIKVCVHFFRWAVQQFADLTLYNGYFLAVGLIYFYWAVIDILYKQKTSLLPCLAPPTDI